MYFKTYSLIIFRLITLLLWITPSLANSHNNPEFTNKLISSIEITPSTGGVSPEFIIEPPKGAVRVVWSINSDKKDNIIFSVTQGDEIIAKDLHDGSETVPGLIAGKNLTISDVQGSESAFKLDILARVIVEKKKTKTTANTSYGKSVYKKANCIGCHKWHGDGGGGYGGAALSLRTMELDVEDIKYTIRCGRPTTGMPYHGRHAYKGDDTSCYETTAKELGENMPPRARTLISERQLNAVVDYVVHVIKGSGEPNHEQCVAYWGEKSRQCDVFKKK
jgi:mono/diheme cytochrome c family protein